MRGSRVVNRCRSKPRHRNARATRCRRPSIAPSRAPSSARARAARRSPPAAATSSSNTTPRRGARAPRSSSRTEPQTATAARRRTTSRASPLLDRAIARCSAPCRRSVRPRSIQTSITAREQSAGRSSSRCGRRKNANDRGAPPPRNQRSRAPPPARPISGEIARPSRASPRTSGIRRSGLRRRRHLALAHRAVDRGERPEPLAHDHDPVGPRHPAEPGSFSSASARARVSRAASALHPQGSRRRSRPATRRAASSLIGLSLATSGRG